MTNDQRFSTAFTAGNTRGWAHATSTSRSHIPRGGPDGTDQMRVRHRSGSFTDFHMHADRMGTATHHSESTGRRINTVLSTRDMSASTRDQIRHLFGQ